MLCLSFCCYKFLLVFFSNFGKLFMLYSKCLQGIFRCMYSKQTKHFSFCPSFFWFWLFIHLNSWATCLFHLIYIDNVASFQQSSMQGKKSLPVIYTSLSQVEMNKDNIIWQGNGWPVSKLYGWVKKWAATAIYALCLWVSRRRREKKRDEGKGDGAGWNGEREMIRDTIQKGVDDGSGRGSEERQVVYCRYPSKTNLYCIKTGRW